MVFFRAPQFDTPKPLPYIQNLAQYAPVAQLDRAFDYESKGRTFESCRVHQPRIAFFAVVECERRTGQRGLNSLTALVRPTIPQEVKLCLFKKNGLVLPKKILSKADF